MNKGRNKKADKLKKKQRKTKTVKKKNISNKAGKKPHSRSFISFESEA